MIRKTLLPFIALMLIFIKPSFAQSPPPGGWKWDNARVTVEKDMQRIRLGVEAQKTYPVAIVDPKTNKITQNVLKAQKSAIKIAPTANKVSRTLLKRTPATAIGYALTAILGRTVDWILDPENNRVKYKDEGNISPSDYYLYSNSVSYDDIVGKNPELVCRATIDAFNDKNGTTHIYHKHTPAPSQSCYFVSKGSAFKIAFYARLVVPDPPTSDAWAYESLDDISRKIIDQANDGQAPAQQVLSDTALDMLEAGELDSALEAAAEPKQYGENEYPPDAVPNPKPDTGTEPETPTDPENPNPNPEPTPWPAFCDWATKMCDLADWIMDDEPLPEDTQIPEQDIELRDPESFDQSYITAPNQCPPDVEKSIPVGNQSVNFVIPMTPVCDFGANVINPVIVFMAFIQAALMIGSAFKVG